MYSVTPDFREAVTASDQAAVVRAAVYLGDDLLGDLLVTSGSVSCDGTSDGALRSLSLTCAPDPDAWGWIVTAGAEIRAWRGLVVDGAPELPAVGVFVIDSDPTEDADGTLTISAADRSRRISRAHWVDPYTIAASVDVGDAIAGILTTCWPACPVGFRSVGKTVGTAVVLQSGSDSDPWKDARGIAQTAGYDLYFDADGVARLRLTPDPDTADPCMTYSDGDASVILKSRRVALLSAIYNGVIATGEGSGVATPVRGECWDEDATSPTYRYGPLGQVPYFYSSPLLLTQSDADSAAQTMFARIKRRSEQWSWDLVPNPALEPFDVVEFQHADGTASRYMLEQITIPLDGSSMSATARESQVL